MSDNKVFYTPQDIAINSWCETIGGRARAIKGDVYTAFGKITSIYGECEFQDRAGGCIKLRGTIKSASGFDNDLMKCYRALAEWRNLGYKGAPSSPAGFFRNAFRGQKRNAEIISRCYASANSIRSYMQGGWIECAVETPYVYGKVFHYDINRAYQSTITAGLPSRLFPYQKGMDGFCVLAENIKGDNLPNFLRQPRAIITSEDIEVMGISSFDPLIGVSYRDLDINLNNTMYQLSSIEEGLFKRVGQSFWGIFAMREPIEVEYRTGSERKMFNYSQNVVWAQLIIRRVVHEVYRKVEMLGAFSVFVDSILCHEEMPAEFVGEDPGQWKHVDTYPRGIYIENAGAWNPLPFNPRTVERSKWKKHAGTRSFISP